MNTTNRGPFLSNEDYYAYLNQGRNLPFKFKPMGLRNHPCVKVSWKILEYIFNDHKSLHFFKPDRLCITLGCLCHTGPI